MNISETGMFLGILLVVGVSSVSMFKSADDNRPDVSISIVAKRGLDPKLLETRLREFDKVGIVRRTSIGVPEFSMVGSERYVRVVISADIVDSGASSEIAREFLPRSSTG